jgi:protein-S-isoprenylcysteine O-methyltransferase Ste14
MMNAELSINCSSFCILHSALFIMVLISELTNAIGASFFVFLFILRVMQFEESGVVSVLLAAQSAFAAFLLIMHKPVERVSHPLLTFISWVCALLPLSFDVKHADMLYSLPGLLLALWSLFALGFSFSIAPEDRGIVERGPYRWLRHPMYLGEIISLLGLCISSMDVTWNWLALIVFARLIVLRISTEERVIAGYERYRKFVRWRLLPFIW